MLYVSFSEYVKYTVYVYVRGFFPTFDNNDCDKRFSSSTNKSPVDWKDLCEKHTGRWIVRRDMTDKNIENVVKSQLIIRRLGVERSHFSIVCNDVMKR